MAGPCRADGARTLPWLPAPAGSRFRALALPRASLEVAGDRSPLDTRGRPGPALPCQHPEAVLAAVPGSKRRASARPRALARSTRMERRREPHLARRASVARWKGALAVRAGGRVARPRARAVKDRPLLSPRPARVHQELGCAAGRIALRSRRATRGARVARCRA